MNAEGASPVHIDSKRWKAPRSSSSRPPSREGVASRISGCHESKALRGAKTSRRSFRKKRSRRHAGRALQPRIGSRGDDIGCPKGERGGDCSTLCRRHRASLGSSTASNARERNFGTFTATFARPFDLHAVLATPRRWARSSKPVSGKQLVSSAQWAQARGAGETRGRQTSLEHED
jgi:hypothetical protein